MITICVSPRSASLEDSYNVRDADMTIFGVTLVAVEGPVGCCNTPHKMAPVRITRFCSTVQNGTGGGWCFSGVGSPMQYKYKVLPLPSVNEFIAQRKPPMELFVTTLQGSPGSIPRVCQSDVSGQYTWINSHQNSVASTSLQCTPKDIIPKPIRRAVSTSLQCTPKDIIPKPPMHKTKWQCCEYQPTMYSQRYNTKTHLSCCEYQPTMYSHS